MAIYLVATMYQNARAYHRIKKKKTRIMLSPMSEIKPTSQVCAMLEPFGAQTRLTRCEKNTLFVHTKGSFKASRERAGLAGEP